MTNILKCFEILDENKCMKRVSNHGVGLLQIIAGLSIITGMIYMVTNLLNTSLKGQRNIQNKVDFDLITGSITQLIMTPSLCQGAFRKSDNTSVVFDPTVSTTTDINHIVMGNSTLITLNQVVPGGLTISKLQFESLGGTPTSVTISSVNYKEHMLKLNLEAKKQKGSYGGDRLSRQFIMKILTPQTGAQTVELCSSSGSASTSSGSSSAIPSVVSFSTPGSHTWTVPSDVTKVQVEIWGAGGSGNTALGNYNSQGSQNIGYGGKGGGGGGYVRAQKAVTPGDSFSLTVGRGGVGNYQNWYGGLVCGTPDTCDGGESRVQHGGDLISVGGGKAAKHNIALSGEGGQAITIGASFQSVLSLKGEGGSGGTADDQALNDTSRNQRVFGGKGGRAGGNGGMGGIPVTFDMGVSVWPLPSSAPGGGGAGMGAHWFDFPSTGWDVVPLPRFDILIPVGTPMTSIAGSDGMILISY